MKKIYTCHFDSVKVGKKVLKNLNFASINRKEWIGIDRNNLTMSDYNKLKSTFLDLLENWGDFGKYNASRNHMEEEWKKTAGIL